MERKKRHTQSLRANKNKKEKKKGIQITISITKDLTPESTCISTLQM